MAEAIAEDSDGLRRDSAALSDGVLPPAVRIEFERRSNVEGLIHLALHLALILVSGAIAAWGPTALWRLTARVIQAWALAFLFQPFHETTHNTAFASKALNRWVGHALGFVIARPRCHYTYYHYNHHKFTGDPARDPELQNSMIDLSLTHPLSYALYLTGIPFWVDRVSTVFRHGCLRHVLALERRYLTNRTEPIMLREATIYLVAYVTLGVVDATLWKGVLWRWWVLPLLLGQPFLRFYLVAEHTLCPTGNSMLLNTRTTKTYGWYRWLAWNMTYHAEHHAFPTVPFHRLPALHNALRRQGADTVASSGCDPSGVDGYWGVHVGLWRRFLSRG